MNIVFVATEIPFPLDHGHHLRTGNILKCLARDHQIHFIGFIKDEQEKVYLSELRKHCASVEVFPLPEGKFRWRFLGGLLTNLFSSKPFTAQRYYLPAARNRIAELIRDTTIDAVHLDAPWLAPYERDFGDIPKLITTHNVETERLLTWIKVEKNLLAKLYLYLQYLKLRPFEKKIYSKFEQGIVVSEKDRRTLERLTGEGSFVVVPNGVDCDYFRPNSAAPEMNHLIWIGPMGDPYNKDAVDYFVSEIYPRVIEAEDDIRVSFVGSSPTPALQQLARSDSRINITGYVDDIRPLVDKAAIFIAPLRAGGGTKLKVLNAMSQAKAVVTTSIGAEGIAGLSEHNIAIADQPAEFAEKIVYLLGHPQFAKEMGNNARRVILQYYDWKVIYRHMRPIYEAFETPPPRNTKSAV